MDKIKTIFFIALVAMFATSCVSSGDQHDAVIKGQFLGDITGREMQLCRVEHGKKVAVATAKLSEDRRFGFIYSVNEPGIFVINVVTEKTQKPVKKDHNLKRFYLEKGTEVNIELTDGNYSLVNTNNKKNELLSKWNSLVDTVFTYSHGFTYLPLTYEDFFPLLPGYVEQAEMFKKNIASGDSSFDELLKLIVDTDIAGAAMRFLNTPRRKHPKQEDYPEYYNKIVSESKVGSSRILELADGIDYMRGVISYSVRSMPERPKADEVFYVALNLVTNDLLKGYYAIENLVRFRSCDESFLTFKDRVTPYLHNDYLKEKFNDYETSIRKFEIGASAVDFSGKDVNGKEYKLSDFKGNLVYVDVWATWCGPCKAQIPALKELEKKSHGKPITFLSISLDKPSDKQKWVDFVRDNGLKGVQLIASDAFNSGVAKAYGINGIPRFMLFDKEGKIVTIDAPRPSEAKTEDWLYKHL